jgi:hypothetical protein
MRKSRINSSGVRNQTGNGLAVPGNDELFPLFNPIQEHGQLVFCFKGSGFQGSISI